jgi:tRNA(Ile)-lysidine synthase TilS/MesJ
VSVRKRLSPAQGLIRLAVRNSLTSNTKPGQKLLIAVSGGADSLALAAACEFEAKKLGSRSQLQLSITHFKKAATKLPHKQPRHLPHLDLKKWL